MSWQLLAVALLAVALCSQILAQTLTVDDAKARYLVEVVRHVSWPEGVDLDQYRVAVVSSRRATRRAFERLGEVSVAGKPLRLRYFSSAEIDPAAYAAVYLGEEFRSLHAQWNEQAPQTLIVVDGNVPRETQMVSMLEVGGQVEMRLNRENLIRRGFIPSIALLEFAGTREDLSDELRLKQSRLRGLLGEVEAKEQRLLELDQQLARNAESLKEATAALQRDQRALAQTQQQLDRLSADIAAASVESERFQDQLSEQQREFAAKQRELAEQEAQVRQREAQIADLEGDIEAGKAVLQQQSEEIERQRSMLQTKNQTIDAQRESMWLITGVMLVLLTAAFFLLRLNALRTRANLELEKLNKQLYDLATTDSLSGLHNRRQFMALAGSTLELHQSLGDAMSMLMMDIDSFKQINDRYGHAAGDEVIKAVSAALNRDLRQADVLGRLGGEEYAMLLVGCDVKQAEQVANRLCADVSGLTVTVAEHAIRTTISIGVAAVENEANAIERALSRADKALYRAKASGRNQVALGSADASADGMATATSG